MLFFSIQRKGGGEMPVESSNKQRTALRKKVTNKEELIKYLNAHPDSELPFVEVCWEDAVRKCKRTKGNRIVKHLRLLSTKMAFSIKNVQALQNL